MLFSWSSGGEEAHILRYFKILSGQKKMGACGWKRKAGQGKQNKELEERKDNETGWFRRDLAILPIGKKW